MREGEGGREGRRGREVGRDVRGEGVMSEDREERKADIHTVYKL